MSESASASESCCQPASCACDDWLTSFCDYETLTHTYCGETTEFSFARRKDIPQSDIRPEAGVYSQDCQFEISTTEYDISSGIGAAVIDADGNEWIIYRAQRIRSFCLWRLWARNVAACFTLTEGCEIYERDCDCTDCGTITQWELVAKTKAAVFSESGRVVSQNESNDMTVLWRGRMQRWPLEGLPSADHRLKIGGRTFRITGFSDGGQFVPFTVNLAEDKELCLNTPLT